MQKREKKAREQKSIPKVKRSKATAVNENHKLDITRRSKLTDDIDTGIPDQNKIRI